LKRLILLTFFALTIGVVRAADVVPNDINALAEGIFIGQVYPSGNVYLKSFAGDDRTGIAWPANVTLIPISDGKSNLAFAREAAYNKILHDKTENEIVKSVYIPRIEGVDTSHISCGLETTTATVTRFTNVSGDFFHAISSYCPPTEGVAVYKTIPSNFSFLVVALADNIKVAENHQILEKVRRPLSNLEDAHISRLKSTEPINVDCKTTPVYLDSALQRIEIKLSSADVALRISSYENPGCDGRLAEIFLLDILNANGPLKTFEISQYRGTL
jgi:hypothetical protein